MSGAGIALLGLAIGLAAGIALATLRRAPHEGDRRLDARLDAHAAELRRIADLAAAREGAGEQLRAELSGARRVLERLQEREAEHGEVVRRLSTVLAGGAAKGRAGEHVLREHLSQLPPSMLSSDFRVHGKTVEFALVLPDGRRLPVDSKWPALAELEALEAAREPADREACARAVERAVALRAKEVAQYLDPALTAPVAVAAVPDAVYAVLRRAHADCFSKGVVIVPYASALPIVLFLYALVQRFGDAADAQTALAEVGGVLAQLEQIVENKFARAATMLANGTDEFRSSLGVARGSIARARATAGSEGDPTPEARDDDGGVLSLVH